MHDAKTTAYFWLAVTSLVTFGFLFGFLCASVKASASAGSPCQEDEVLIWLNSPKEATCIPLDDLMRVGAH